MQAAGLPAVELRVGHWPEAGCPRIAASGHWVLAAGCPAAGVARLLLTRGARQLHRSDSSAESFGFPAKSTALFDL